MFGGKKNTTSKDVLQAALEWKQSVVKRALFQDMHPDSQKLVEVISDFERSVALDRIEHDVFDDDGETG